MNPTNQEWPEGELRTRVAERVGRLVASSADPAPSRREDERSFEVLEEQLTRRLRAGRHTRSALIFAAALLAGGGSYWGLGRLAPTGDRAISYSVAGGPALQPGPVFAAAPTAPTEVAFSEGTRMQLAPRSRGRVMNLDRRGGRVALDDGNAHVDVRHLPNARWVFQAGPFEVRVHGTSFALGWNPSTAHFDLHMHTGVVSVVGPISGGEMVLRAGESLSVTLEGHDAPAAPSSASKALDRPAPSDTPPPPAQPVPQEKSVRHEPPATSSATSRARSSAAWRAELAAGHAGAVVADAERMGTGRALESASSEDLAALADAARYVGNDDLARRALLAQRRRFTRSSRAAQAAFLLGRLEDESAPGAARALAWYDLYLDEAPRGAYAAEALGRKMMVLERGGRHVEAVAIAADYLRRFPRGSYAHAASVLVGAPGRDALPAGPRP